MITQDEQLEHLRAAVALSKISVDEIVLPEDRHVVLDGMRFHYLDWSPGGTTPILFLHGGALTAHTWDVVCVALRKDYHCIALDQRGHGDSEWSPEMNYGPAAHLKDIERFVEELGLRQFLLVGMSLGGLNSIAYAGRHSDLLKGLVIVDIGPNMNIEGVKQINAFTRDDADLPSVEAFVERALAFNPRRDPHLLRRSLLFNLRQLPAGNWTWKYDRRHRDQWSPEARKAERALLWNDVPNIKCPTLVVRAEQSPVFYEADAIHLAETLPDGRWVSIPNSGHTIQGDNPRDLTIAMRDFFASIGA